MLGSCDVARTPVGRRRLAHCRGSFLVAYFLRFLDTARPYGAAQRRDGDEGDRITSVGFALVNLCFRLHRRAWRYAAGVEVLPIAVAVLISAIAATVLICSIPVAPSSPAERRPCGQPLQRGRIRVFRYRSRIAPAITLLARPASKTGAEPTRAVVYGAGELGQLLVRRLRTHADGRRYRIVGFLDDDPRKHGLTVHGIKVVGGRDVLRAFVAKENVDVIVLAMGTTTGTDMRDILAIAQGTAAQIKVAHDVVNWMGDRYSAALLRDMRAEDLIGRQAPVWTTNAAAISWAAERCSSPGVWVHRVRVDPADPSAAAGPDRGRRHERERPLRPRGRDQGAQGRGGDANRRRRCHQSRANARPRSAERPEVIFHVAAYKHVRSWSCIRTKPHGPMSGVPGSWPTPRCRTAPGTSCWCQPTRP